MARNTVSDSMLPQGPAAERSFQCPEALWQPLVELAALRHCSVDSLLCQAIEEHLERHATAVGPPSSGAPTSTTQRYGSPGQPEVGPDIEVTPDAGKTKSMYTTIQPAPPRPPPSAVERVLIACAEEDHLWLARLKRQLKPLERSGLLDVWDDTRVQAGDVWIEEMERALSQASAVVLLISGAFLASELISEQTVPRMLLEAKERGLAVMPLLVSPCLFAESPLGHFQPFNAPGKELTSLKPYRRDELLVKVARTIRPGDRAD